VVKGIVQLTEGIGHLRAIDIELETVVKSGSSGFFLARGEISVGSPSTKVGWIRESSTNSSKSFVRTRKRLS
jgi:hypothetical protein